jgi:hypothetical protein
VSTLIEVPNQYVLEHILLQEVQGAKAHYMIEIPNEWYDVLHLAQIHLLVVLCLSRHPEGGVDPCHCGIIYSLGQCSNPPVLQLRLSTAPWK